MEWHDRIGRRLKLRDLHTLLAVARRGSMAKAAAELAVSQPAISKVVSELEHALGVRLLDRKPQGVEPTLYGQALLKWSDAVFEELRHVVQEIQALADPTAGEVRVCGTGSMVDGLLPAAIDRLSRQYPRIAVNVTQATITEQQYQELRERKLDVLIGRIPLRPTQDDLSIEIPFDEPIFVVAGASNPWARRRRMVLADLVDEPWVLPPKRSAIGAYIAEAFQANGLNYPGRVVVCSSLQFTYALIATGRHLGTFPGSLFHFGGKRYALKVLPVTLPGDPPPVSMVTLKNRTLAPAAKLFIDCIRGIAKSLATRSKRPT